MLKGTTIGDDEYNNSAIPNSYQKWEICLI